MKLTNKEYWDSLYHQKGRACNDNLKKSNTKISFLKNLRQKFRGQFNDYNEYLFWDIILPQYLSGKKEIKALEIGSAPGDFLIKLKQAYGVIPFGVEFSESGSAYNKDLFSKYGINPDNIICGDFLTLDFQSTYKEYFDMVISRGLIEHFTDVENIIEKHIALLKSGGCLLISIPNLRKINYIFTWIFNRNILAIHNLDIMKKEVFFTLFKKARLETRYCDYYGLFTFNLFNTAKGSFLCFFHIFLRYLQLFISPLIKLTINNKNVKGNSWSPYLMYIGIKRSL